MTEEQTRFTKISAGGEDLPDDAAEWEAVRDNRSGLLWSVNEQRVKSQQEAAEAAESMTAAGFSDWRLPTVEELFPLADRSRSRPAIDTDYFPECASDWYWTSTPAAPSPGVCAWLVYFYDGYALWYDRDYGGFVRAVRTGQ